MQNNSSEKEYESIRQEIIARAKLLHQIINLGIILLAAFSISITWLAGQKIESNLIEHLLLLIPIVYAGLIFNYQANQMTLEALAQYLKEKYRYNEWDKFYGRYKIDNRLTSFSKVIPLLLPLFTPLLVILLKNGLPTDILGLDLLVLDLILLVPVVLNFRYKLRH